jgi:prevent-host-death family protein
MDRVCEDHTPVIITRSGQQSVVMLSLEDYKSLEETAYLLRSPKNAKRLLSAVASLGQLSTATKARVLTLPSATSKHALPLRLGRGANA